MTIVNEYASAAVSDRGLSENRPHNEDSFLELTEHGLFAVADGVGGAQAGEVASQMAVEILAEAFINMGANADPEETMRIALDRANGAIFQMSHDLPQLSSMATTIAALHVNGDIATIAHVGDSRVYRMDGHGRLFRETDDHSIVEEEVRAGRMTPAQALTHPSRNVISRALGAEHAVDADIKLVLVYPGTRFLLCSDGITRHVSDAEIESMLNSDDEPSAICARMKDLCFSRGAEDNLTAVIVSFAGERAAPPAYDPSEDVTMPGIRSNVPTAGVTVENNIVGTDNAAGMQDSILELDDLTSDELVDVQAAEESHEEEGYLMENGAEVDDALVSAAAKQSKAYSFSEKEHADDSSVSVGAKFSPAYSPSQQEEATADPIRPAVRQRNELNAYSRSSFGVVPMVGLLILGVLTGPLVTVAHASDFKENPDRWQCAYSYNAGGRAVWVYGDTVQWKPDAIATARSACRAKSGKCVSLGCFRRL